eukprot:7183580-Pyramimonas_sp.AAC.1
MQGLKGNAVFEKAKVRETEAHLKSLCDSVNLVEDSCGVPEEWRSKCEEFVAKARETYRAGAEARLKPHIEKLARASRETEGRIAKVPQVKNELIFTKHLDTKSTSSDAFANWQKELEKGMADIQSISKRLGNENFYETVDNAAELFTTCNTQVGTIRGWAAPAERESEGRGKR